MTKEAHRETSETILRLTEEMFSKITEIRMNNFLDDEEKARLEALTR